MTFLDRGQDFHDFGGATYLNCAYQGPMPRVAIAALERAVRFKTRPHELTDADYFEIPDAYRRAVGELVGCSPEHVAVTDSTTHGITLLSRGLEWREGDEVIIPAGEFPANRLPWLALESGGVRVREIELPAGAVGVDRLADAIGDRTRVVSAAWVRYQTGERRDVAAIGRLCRERNVLFAIDGSQGVGGLELDLESTPCDLLAGSGYKWMLGPYGLGFAYVSPRLADRLDPPNVNWQAVEGARDFSRLGECSLAFEPGARRFDINETANLFNVLSATAAVEYLLELGVAAAEAHVKALEHRLLEGLPAGFRRLGGDAPSERSNIVCLAAESEDLLGRAARRLDVLRVIFSRREGALRFSPFVYNGPRDIDLLLAGLKRAADG